jgi:hypothetical protein
MNKPLEWDELMKPYRESRLFCKDLSIRRVSMVFSKQDIIAGIKEMGYNEVEAMYYYNIIEEVKKRGLMERKGDED